MTGAATSPARSGKRTARTRESIENTQVRTQRSSQELQNQPTMPSSGQRLRYFWMQNLQDLTLAILDQHRSGHTPAILFATHDRGRRYAEKYMEELHGRSSMGKNLIIRIFARGAALHFHICPITCNTNGRPKLALLNLWAMNGGRVTTSYGNQIACIMCTTAMARSSFDRTLRSLSTQISGTWQGACGNPMTPPCCT